MHAQPIYITEIQRKVDWRDDSRSRRKIRKKKHCVYTHATNMTKPRKSINRKISIGMTGPATDANLSKNTLHARSQDLHD